MKRIKNLFRKMKGWFSRNRELLVTFARIAGYGFMAGVAIGISLNALLWTLVGGVWLIQSGSVILGYLFMFLTSAFITVLMIKIIKSVLKGVNNTVDEYNRRAIMETYAPLLSLISLDSDKIQEKSNA